VKAALAARPRDKTLLYALGAALDRAGQGDAAVAQMRALLAIDPDHADALNFVAYSLADQGALIAILWGLAHGHEVSGFVLSSPYLRLAFLPNPLKVATARVLGQLVPWLPVSTGLRVGDLTSDPDLQRATERDPLYGRKTTPRWFEEANRAQAEAFRRPGEFRAPVLVLAAGADRIADVRATRRWFEDVGSGDKRLLVYEGFRHEIFNELERDRPIREAIGWLEARATVDGH